MIWLTKPDLAVDNCYYMIYMYQNYEIPKLSRTDFSMRGWAKGFFFNLRKGSDYAKPLDVGGTDPT